MEELVSEDTGAGEVVVFVVWSVVVHGGAGEEGYVGEFGAWRGWWLLEGEGGCCIVGGGVGVGGGGRGGRFVCGPGS